jgi:MFS family permease
VLENFGDPIDTLDPEDATGERVLVLLLAVATLLASVFLLIPFLAVRDVWRKLPRKGTSAIYFAALGFGFMFFEITLIQRLTLFLGYPTYSLTVTLASLLLFTGVGALLSGRVKDRAYETVPWLLGAIAVLTGFYLFVLPKLTDALLGWPLAGRVLVAFVVLAPLGLCLGMFMPLGIGAVASLTPHQNEYVAWGWAVNGFASVIGSVLTTILAMAFGFHTVLVLALAVYVLALLTLRVLVRPGAAPAMAS